MHLSSQDVEDEINSIITLAKLTDYEITIKGFDPIIYRLNKENKNKKIFEIHVHYYGNKNNIKLLWIKREYQNLIVSSTATDNNDLTFPLKVLKMLL